jgi:hypothetical protein
MKTIAITETFEYFPDGSEETRRVYKAGAVETLPDDEAGSFVERGLAAFVPEPAAAPVAKARAVKEEEH